jgi:hypothetical protein
MTQALRKILVYSQQRDDHNCATWARREFPRGYLRKGGITARQFSNHKNSEYIRVARDRGVKMSFFGLHTDVSTGPASRQPSGEHVEMDVNRVEKAEPCLERKIAIPSLKPHRLLLDSQRGRFVRRPPHLRISKERNP